MGNTKLQEENLVVKMSPHIRAKNTSQWIMLQVIIALLFPTVAGSIIFGPKVLAFVLVGATAAAFSEYVYQKLFGKQVTVVRTMPGGRSHLFPPLGMFIMDPWRARHALVRIC